ncbi:aldo/keto reductase [Chitinophaga arvensicola]|uniref:Predicted oxidoreductase n=1 Tax=Chitinophaga arvensicola TaxID=29529 RepID=A0A1I0SDP9_9BACT|nr:aldo/keto reductase [Chitinophaga arvensicola]SEW56342.1 Predicted oxidoreductase [Chitinophaga arvensicola]
MKYTTLGNTGLIVSRLSFGAMTFGSHPSMPTIYKVSEAEAGKMIDASLDAGINFFDTADGYAAGQSEVMLGKLLSTKRHDVVIASKVGFRTGTPLTQSGLSRRHILYSCDQSLQRLGTDYIDLYIVHREDPVTPLEETLSTLDGLVKSGKVRYIGFSNWSVWKSALAWQLQHDNGWATFCNGQMNYTLVGRDVEHDIVPFMQHAGIGMTVWGPLAGGFLSGKYTRENLQDAGNRLSGFDVIPFDKEKGFVLVDKMKEIAAVHGATVAQIAMAWLLTKPVVSSVLIGASKMQQLEDNLKAINIELSGDELSLLDNLTAPAPLYPKWFNQNLADQLHAGAGLLK